MSTFPAEIANSAHPLEFRGHSYRVTALGSSRPSWVLESFLLERDVRERWWDPREGELVIDVGAAYGSYTLAALAAGAGVVAFEPNKEDFFTLYTNILLNGFLERCLLLNALAGETEGDGIYYPTSHSARPEGVSERRLQFTLDGLIGRMQLARVDRIKIDVEGAELSVLKGADRTLEKFRPSLLIENHAGFLPGIDQDVREFLLPRGYREENFAPEPDKPNNNWSYWTP